MLNMSFYDGTLNRVTAKKVIARTDKPLKYTSGLGYRNPAINKKPVSKDEAFEIIDNQGFLTIKEYEDYIHLNSYSSNDMF